MADQPQNSSPLTLPNAITIRPYHPSDAPALSHQANNRAIWDNLRNRMPHPYLESHALFWINLCNDPSNWTPSGPYHPPQTPPEDHSIAASGPKLPTNYVVVVNGEPAGSIGIDFGSPTDVYAQCAEIGYWLGESYWSQGVMKAVVPAFVDWAWRTFGVLVRLNAEVEEGNMGSRKVLEVSGFQVEGRRERAMVKNGVVRNVVFMGMLRPEKNGQCEMRRE